MQDIRAKIFPFRRKIRTPEVTPSISLPVKRKERSLSSLVVSTPKVSIKAGLTGRRTKSVGRKSAPVRASSFAIEEPTKKEELPTEIFPENSNSTEILNKVQDKNQVRLKLGVFISIWLIFHHSSRLFCEDSTDFDLILYPCRVLPQPSLSLASCLTKTRRRILGCGKEMLINGNP